MDSEVLPPEAPKNSGAASPFVRKKPGPKKGTKYGPRGGTGPLGPRHYNQAVAVPGTVAAKRELRYAMEVGLAAQRIRQRQEFSVRLYRHLELNNWTKFTDGLKILMNKFRKGDPWAMEFVRDSLQGKPASNTGGAEGEVKPSVNIIIGTDDAKLL